MREENTICPIISCQGQSEIDCNRLIGEKKKKKGKKEWTFSICKSIDEKKRRMIDAECRDIHNPVNINKENDLSY